jgi:hypothetical protein
MAALLVGASARRAVMRPAHAVRHVPPKWIHSIEAAAVFALPSSTWGRPPIRLRFMQTCRCVDRSA